jgi:hypothetical protein
MVLGRCLCVLPSCDARRAATATDDYSKGKTCARQHIHTQSHRHEFSETVSPGKSTLPAMTRLPLLTPIQEMVQVGSYPSRMATKINAG